MKPITCLITATVGLALTAPAHAQADCADWNTGAFLRGRRDFGRDPVPASGCRPERTD